MNYISKQSGVLVTKWNNDAFLRAETKLTLWYAAVMVLVLGIISVSVLVLFIMTFPVIDHGERVEYGKDSFKEEVYEGEIVEHLSNIIVQVDLILLVLVVVAAYLLARRSIAPLREADARQKRFVADVAHEFRTPLSIIRASAEISLKNNTLESYKKSSSDVVQEVEDLDILLKDLLDLARAGEIKTKRDGSVDVSRIVEDSVSVLENVAVASGIVLDTQISSRPQIRGDENEIRRLFMNLIKNAIDYNKENGKVSVSLSVSGKDVIIKVSDTGVGIGAADLPYVFDRFYKANKARDKSRDKGAGLGLAIVSEIVKAHKGTIGIVSKPGEGTTFEVRLPKE